MLSVCERRVIDNTQIGAEMCGIAGIVHLDKAPAEPSNDSAILKLAAAQLAHRGPDDEQFHLWKNVGLAFRRLSIVDVEDGRQPLANEDGSIVVVCNGEIYNHRDLRSVLKGQHSLGSQSDCEIIAHLYEDFGVEFIKYLNGMFAFALLDKRHRRLILARDRLGIKPLFYYLEEDLLVFGSEIKAVLCHPDVPKAFDWYAALTWRTTMYYPHRHPELTSFFVGIHQVPAGNLIEIDLDTGAMHQKEYWSPQAAAAAQETGYWSEYQSRNDYIRAYRDLLDESVKLQLMADVNCGLFLSGGIDSVAVAYYAAKHKPIHTFTVLSQSTVTNGDAPSAHAAAMALGLVNHQVLFDWRSLAVPPRYWKTMLWDIETPFAGAEQLYKYNLHAYARATVPNLKVMLLGTGSDEFNGGYTKAVFNTAENPSWNIFESIMRSQESACLMYLTRAWNSYTGFQAEGRSIISRNFLSELTHEKSYEYAWHGYRDMYRQLMQTYQLWHEDRTSAAHGIENRVPFLDHRLVELTYAVPVELHSDLFWDKTILREALGDALPAELCQRPKVPFFAGEDERYTRRLIYNLLNAEERALVEESICEAAEHAGVVDGEVMRTVFANLPNDPEYGSVDMLLDLVNMGLLAAMARRLPTPGQEERNSPINSVEIRDWSDWAQRFGVDLVRRARSLSTKSVLRFAEGIRIAKHEAGDPQVAEEGGYYVLRNNELKFALESSLDHWVSFLRCVDGRHSVSDILAKTHINEGDIWKHLEESIEYEVLQIVD